MSILRKCREQAEMRLTYYQKQQGAMEGNSLVTKWEQLMSFLTVISRKMEDAHQKIVMMVFPNYA